MKNIQIFSISLIILLFCGCLELSEKENNNEKTINIVLLYGFPDYPLYLNYTTSVDVFIDNEIKFSIRDYTFPPISPMYFSVDQFNTTKEEIKIKVIEYIYGLSNETIVNVFNAPNILIWMDMPDKIEFDASDQIIDLM